MRRMNFSKMVPAAFAIFFFAAWMDPFSDEVSKGNDNYRNNRSADALKNYNEAEKYAPGESKKKMLEFNRGDAEFRLNRYDSAISKYRNSLNSNDPDIQKKALYNIGNAYMKMGKKREAAENFIKALQIDPSYDKAKKNLEYLLKSKPQDKGQGGDSGKGGGKQNQAKDAKNDSRKQGTGDDKKSNAQVQNLMESMKNKPVRKQKDSGNGKRYLEKFW